MANQFENMGATNHRVKPEDKKDNDNLVYTGEHKFGEAAGMVVETDNPEEVRNLAEEE